MTRAIYVVALSIILLVGRLASADDYDDCVATCDKGHADCVAKASQFVNDIEVQDAKELCNNSFSGCRPACDEKEEIRSGRREPAQEQSANER